MFRRRGLVGLVATLFLVAVIVIGGVSLYRAGFSQGYLSAASVAGGEQAAPLPGSPALGFYAPYPGFFTWGPLFGLLLGGGFLLFLVLGIGRFFAFRAWARGQDGGSWEWKGGPMHRHRWHEPDRQAPPQEAPDPPDIA